MKEIEKTKEFSIGDIVAFTSPSFCVVGRIIKKKENGKYLAISTNDHNWWGWTNHARYATKKEIIEYTLKQLIGESNGQ